MERIIAVVLLVLSIASAAIAEEMVAEFEVGTRYLRTVDGATVLSESPSANARITELSDEQAAEALSEYVLAQDLTAEQALVLLGGFEAWQSGKAYSVDGFLRHGMKLYRVVQAHTSQVDWTPDAVPALFAEVAPPGTIPDWVQPTGAHDAYNIGDKVLFDGRIYESKINANVWSPSAYPAGWTDLGEP
jgi:hypothetical protein